MSDRIHKAHASLESKQALNLVVESATGPVVGWVKVARYDNDARRGDLTYWLGSQYHGFGFATEASAALLPIAFEWLDLDVIEAGAQPDNHASFGVMRHLGMRPIGEKPVWVPSRGRYETCLFYELPRPT